MGYGFQKAAGIDLHLSSTLGESGSHQSGAIPGGAIPGAALPQVLVRLRDTPFLLADAAADVRGCRIVDGDGENLGVVNGLFVDEDGLHVYLLEIARGGFLGFGTKRSLTPAAAITGVRDGIVYISLSKSEVEGAPRYNPRVITGSPERICDAERHLRYYDYPSLL